jgi:hypothetical protein
LASKADVTADFASGGLILFNAAVAYELVAGSHSLDPLSQVRSAHGSWKATFTKAFGDAFAIDYEAVFLYAIRVLDVLPAGPTSEHALTSVYNAAEQVVSHAGIVSLDLAGRVYHSTLGRVLAKSFATCYTTVPAAELLAGLSVDRWDDRVADFACGSGTLLVAAYHRKLALAFLQGWTGTVADLHRRFVQDEIHGFDAMPFAAHLSLVNLLLQQPTTPFERSNIVHVPVGEGKRLGSLDLLRSDKVSVQQKITGSSVGARKLAISKTYAAKALSVPRRSFDVVIMNPPFTKKQLVTQVLDTGELKRVLSLVNQDLTPAGGLPIPFVALGDLSLKDGGRLALVLPVAILGRDSWQGVRDILAKDYRLDAIALSWVEGTPAFSDDSDIREVMVVATKRAREGKADWKAGDDTILMHLDQPMNFSEGRQVADLLRRARPNSVGYSLLSGNTLALKVGKRQLGEAISVPRGLVSATKSNWYRLVAFHDPRLVRQTLGQNGLVSDLSPPFGFDLSGFLGQVDGLSTVGLFVKGVKYAGFQTLSSKPAGASTPVLMSSSVQKLVVGATDVEWLVKDYSIQSKDTFTPGKGLLLLPRRVNLKSTARVGAVVAWTPTGGSMWIPCQPRQLKSSDGTVVSPEEVARLVALWSHSTFGLSTLVMERQETEGAWGEWLTQALRTRLVLDPRRLKSSQIALLLTAWKAVEGYDWELLCEQLSTAASDPKHPRAVVDRAVLKATGQSENGLAEFCSALSAEISLLGRVM